jgi:hypothetical protein
MGVSRPTEMTIQDLLQEEERKSLQADAFKKAIHSILKGDF